MESDSSVSTQDLGVADSVVMASAAAAGVGSGVNFTCINGSGELLGKKEYAFFRFSNCSD